MWRWRTRALNTSKDKHLNCPLVVGCSRRLKSFFLNDTMKVSNDSFFIKCCCNNYAIHCPVIIYLISLVGIRHSSLILKMIWNTLGGLKSLLNQIHKSPHKWVCFPRGSRVESIRNIVCKTKAILANHGRLSHVGRALGSDLLRSTV